MRTSYLALVCLVSIGGSVAVAAPAMEPPLTRALRRLQLTARALEALMGRFPSDYRRPFEDPPTTSDAHDRYLELCEDGDASACWIAGGLEWWKVDGKARARVVEHCRAGDLASCQALPAQVAGFPDLPGRQGRTEACTFLPQDGTTCDFAALKQECIDGFAQSCYRLATTTLSREQIDFAEARLPLGLPGCEAFALNQCRALTLGASDATRVLVSTRECAFGLGGCDKLATEFRARGDLARARDLDERACQYGVGTDRGPNTEQAYLCLALSTFYLDGTYREPVPGRGKALRAWSCQRESLREHMPECRALASRRK
jgi:hypothetical protein